MNDNDIYSIDFTRCLPPVLKNDPKMVALAQSIAEQLHITADQISKNIIYARIDELDERTLDIIAYDLHIDWYDFSYPIEAKRRTIKESVKIHRKLGTKYAVEAALGAVFPGTRIEEWFEYGGDPYMFRVIIGVSESGLTAERQDAVLERIRFYKNLRSHLESISYRMEERATVQVGAIHSVGTRLKIYPYTPPKITQKAAVFVAGTAAFAHRLEIGPMTNDPQHTLPEHEMHGA